MHRLFYVVVALVATERIVELAIAGRNIRRAMARGGIEIDKAGYHAMVPVHAGFLLASVLEVRLFDRPWHPPLGLAMLGVLAAAMALRYWVVLTLGDRWSTRIVLVPGDRMIARGPFRFMRHPNYLAVVIEFVALPLIHTAWLTAIVFSALNGLTLRRRIRNEDSALRQYLLPPDEGTS